MKTNFSLISIPHQEMKQGSASKFSKPFSVVSSSIKNGFLEHGTAQAFTIKAGPTRGGVACAPNQSP